MVVWRLLSVEVAEGGGLWILASGKARSGRRASRTGRLPDQPIAGGGSGDRRKALVAVCTTVRGMSRSTQVKLQPFS